MRATLSAVRIRPPAVYVVLSLSVVGLVLAYGATALSTVALWSKDQAAHGYFVIPIAAYLAWDRRHLLDSLRPVATFWALPVLGLLSFVWLLGNLTGTDVVQQLCLVGMCVALIWGVLGSTITRALAFPLGFLLFALPLADRLIPALQDVTARVAVGLLELSGFPVLLQQHVISIPGSSWYVAEACGGIRYLTSSVAFGYVYAGLMYRDRRHRIGFFVASALIPLVANGIRVYGTIFLSSVTGADIVAGTRHFLFGWVVFAVMIGILIATCGHWQEQPQEDTPAPLETGPVVRQPSRLGNAVLVASLGVVVAAIAPVSAKLLWFQSEGAIAAAPARPTIATPWSASDRDPYKWKPRFVAPRAEFVQTYYSGQRLVKVLVASYSARQPGVKLASAANTLFEAPWVPVAERYVGTTVDGQAFNVRETLLQSTNSSLLVWSWYVVDGIPTSSDLTGKYLLAKARLTRSPRGYAVVAVATEASLNAEATTTLTSFVQHLSFENAQLAQHRGGPQVAKE